jgi:diadenosine tetraphosphate (Ap4A) HIT family hydrolase
VYRDDQCIAFMDIQPATQGHLLVVPLRHAPQLADLEPGLGAVLFEVALRMAACIRRSGLRAEGVNLTLADGAAAGQEVDHIHLHVVPRFAGDGCKFRFGTSCERRVSRERLDSDAALISLATLPA